MRREEKGDLPSPEKDEAEVPGAKASVVHASRIWTMVFDTVCRARTKLGLAFFSAKTSPARQRAPAGKVWPCPLPFPELHQRKANRHQVDAARKLALNYVVLVMDVFHNGQSHFARAVPGLGTPLNKEQWEMIRRWTPLIDEWNNSCPITSEEMGRSAAKVENVEKVLSALQEEAVPIARDLKSYLGKESSGIQSGFGNRGGAGEVVGRLRAQIDHVAKALQPERLKFWKTPTFEAAKFLDQGNRETFLKPLDHAAPPDLEEVRPPKVRVRIKEEDVSRFLGLLDSTNRLALVEETKVRAGFECGAFAVPKDGKRDRMVLDARPPNCLERSEKRWIRSLGTTSQLQHVFIKDSQALRLFAEDLREYYHCFLISEQRVLRNSFKLRVLAEKVRHLSACDSSFGDKTVLAPCLRTMAMGDLNAVAYGQAAHLGVLVQGGLLKVENLIALKKRPPRGDWFAGLMIDDLLVIEKVPINHTKEETERTLLMKNIHAEYEKVGLPRHEGKSIAGETEGSFWGVQLDGRNGRARPNLSRAVPLVKMLAEVCRTGFATVGLLELLAGSLVSIFQLRRRFMANLEAIYAAQRGRSRSDIIQISDVLKDELLSSIALVVLTQIDFRLKPSPYLVATDASMTAEAGVRSFIGEDATEEFQRHTLQKGLWSRLLRPEQAYLREKDMLEPEEQLPEDAEDHYEIHPIWQEACEVLPFRVFGEVKKVRRRRHINLGEIDAALKAEEIMGAEQSGSFYVHLQDSQVSLAALIKGRSSSRSINLRLKQSIPSHAGSGIKPFYGFVDSSRNPSDDPTRKREVRKPQRSAAQWFSKALEGDFGPLDARLSELGVHLDQVSELPEESELYADVPIDTRTRRQLRLTRRNRRLRKEEKREDERMREAERTPSVVELKTPLKGEGRFAEDEKAGESCVAPESEARLGEKEPRTGGAEEKKKASKAPAWCDAILSSFSESQFLYDRKKFGSLEEAVKSGPGVLDLFSGAKGFARRAVSLGAPWVVTFDILHHPSENLSKIPLQEHLIKLIAAGAFLAMGAGPVCSSFSTAITPPTRTLLHPGGVPWGSDLQRRKNEEGNEQLRFILRLCLCCLEHGVIFWIENPDSSWIWRQHGELSWEKVLAYAQVGDLRLDYCRFGTAWRKRTRFRTNSHLKNQSCFCRCVRRHVQLRGRCKSRGVNYTKLAEAYPSGVCDVLAKGILIDCGWLGNKRHLDVAACARCTNCRIGEAENPGPRGPPKRNFDISLAEFEVLEPGTVAIRTQIWRRLSDWCDLQFGRGFLDKVVVVPVVFVQLLIAFGYHCYETGSPLHYYRQLLAHVQKQFIGLRPYMSPAWEVCTRWHIIEPTQHRPPLPEALLRAMSTVGLSWGWTVWTAVLICSFYSASRIGELLRAKRRHVLTPVDLLSERKVLYVQIISPKSRRAGAIVQYVTVTDREIVKFLTAVWQDWSPDASLFPGSPGSFRSRWDAILKHMGVGKEHRLTPGSVRAGGAVYLHQTGTGIFDLMWRMRLAHQKTLTHYLQEVVASSILPSLSSDTRQKIQALQVALPIFLKAKTGPAAHIVQS